MNKSKTNITEDDDEIRKLIKLPKAIIEETKKKLIHPNSLTTLKQFADNFATSLKDQVKKKMGISQSTYNNLSNGFKEIASYGKVFFSPIDLTADQLDKLIEIAECFIQELQEQVKVMKAKKRTQKKV